MKHARTSTSILVVVMLIASACSRGDDTTETDGDATALSEGGFGDLEGALAGFLRFWLVRDLHERRAQTDRIVGGDRPRESELT